MLVCGVTSYPVGVVAHPEVPWVVTSETPWLAVSLSSSTW